MLDAWAHQLERWHDFFVLIGTAGVTLTGLLFVVVSLGPGVVAKNRATGVRAFVTPNAVFFTTALVVAAVLLIPDLPATAAGAFLCIGAAASIVYLISTRASQHWRFQKLPVEDWVWYIGLPLVSYLLLFAGGAGILSNAAWSFHTVAIGLILLLVAGIHNAWDLVIWITNKEHGTEKS
jgi:hypothetical protein